MKVNKGSLIYWQVLFVVSSCLLTIPFGELHDSPGTPRLLVGFAMGVWLSSIAWFAGAFLKK